MKTFYTSNYARNGQHPMAVSISAYLPKWGFGGRWYQPLAPSKKILHAILNDEIGTEEYGRLYMEYIAATTTVEQVVKDLQDGSVLLCFEKPTDHCHRHLVRDWLNNSGLCKVEEIYTDKEKAKMFGPAPIEPAANSLEDLFCC